MIYIIFKRYLHCINPGPPFKKVHCHCRNISFGTKYLYSRISFDEIVSNFKRWNNTNILRHLFQHIRG
ncbi:hypothetical protein HK096_000536 [Nowakowskiella sp. JEL0078]|nr:hypothetical protein HK096_000536 [Nowakowskiella sp. JEL0078]